MSKLLPTRLPISYEDPVSSNVYNRLIRILELNLGSTDPDNTRQANTAQRDQENPSPGMLIFNTNTDTIQCWDGARWRDLFASQFYVNNDLGFGLTGSLGTVSVTTS